MTNSPIQNPGDARSRRTSGLPDLRTSGLLLLLAGGIGAADLPRGQSVFTTYCSACHGPEGAGLVGPNLTDTVFLHGGTRADILRTLMQGVGDKGMPAWGAILPPADVEAVADFAVSLIGKNLKSPFAPGESSVTPFPKGSAAFPLLMRTFMPTLGIDAAVFAHHHHGLPAAKYSPEKGSDVDGTEKPVDGVPSAIAVNFGDTLSYCFDTTECRLLYTWSGPFMDMTRYWGAAAGGGRKSMDYVPVVNGPVWWRTAASESLLLPDAGAAAPQFTGYRKSQQVPELQWRVGEVQVALRVTPGPRPGVALCRYTVTGAAKGLVFTLPADSAERISADKGVRTGATLTLSAADAAQFTLTILPADQPVVEAPKPPKAKEPGKGGQDDKAGKNGKAGKDDKAKQPKAEDKE